MKKIICNYLSLAYIFVLFFSSNVTLQLRQPEKAYMLVVEDCAKLNEKDKFLAVNLESVKRIDSAKLIKLLQKYCDEYGVTLLLDDAMDRYIVKDDGMVGWHFTDGVKYVSLCDQKLTKDALVMDAAFVACGMQFTVKYLGGTWQLADKQLTWIV